MGVLWSCVKHVPNTVDPYVQTNQVDNDLSSRLLQLPPDLQDKIASFMPPVSRTNKGVAATCRGLQAMAFASTGLVVSGDFLNSSVASEFLCRFNNLHTLAVRLSHTCVRPVLNLTPLKNTPKLRHLDLAIYHGHRILFQLVKEECDVIASLKGLQSMRLAGFEITDTLCLSPTVTDVILDRCMLSEAGALITGTGIKKLTMGACVNVIQAIDLRCMPALTDVDIAFITGDLLLSMPSVLNILKTETLSIPGDILAQLTLLTTLMCSTQSEVVDLRACAQLRTLTITSDTMTRLDVSDCAHLVSLTAARSELLCDLDVSGCSQLRTCDLTGCAFTRQPLRSEPDSLPPV